MLLFKLILQTFILVIFLTSTKICNEILNVTDLLNTTSVEDIVTDDFSLRVVCPHFKNAGDINLEEMVGIWRPVYYQVSHKVPCFDMLIRKVTSKEKEHYFEQYGDFNEKIIWDDCNLQIKSSLVSRKHFLQGCQKGFGVMENIIIEWKGNSTTNLVDESADQWLVVKNLLLMKDCVSGEIVVFSRDYYRPKLTEVTEAVRKFGNISEGEWACSDANKTEPHAFDGQFESENDVTSFEQ